MKYITTILKKILPKQVPKPVGRWSIEQCNIHLWTFKFAQNMSILS